MLVLPAYCDLLPFPPEAGSSQITVHLASVMVLSKLVLPTSPGVRPVSVLCWSCPLLTSFVGFDGGLRRAEDSGDRVWLSRTSSVTALWGFAVFGSSVWSVFKR